MNILLLVLLIWIYFPCTVCVMHTDSTFISETAYKGQVQLAGGDCMTNPRTLMLYTSTDDGAPEWGEVCIPPQLITSLHTLAGTVCRQLGFTNYSEAQVKNRYI